MVKVLVVTLRLPTLTFAEETAEPPSTIKPPRSLTGRFVLTISMLPLSTPPWIHQSNYSTFSSDSTYGTAMAPPTQVLTFTKVLLSSSETLPAYGAADNLKPLNLDLKNAVVHIALQ